MAIEFSRGAAQYRDTATGRFVGRGVVEGYVQQEVNRLEVRLKGVYRLAEAGKISTAEFQTRFAQTLKDYTIQSAVLGAGGRDQMSPTHWGKVGSSLKQQYRRIGGMGEALAKGELSEKQIAARIRQYSESSRAAFHSSNKRTHQDVGFTQARRSLDGGAKHCEECPGYSTNGEWIPIDEVVSPGDACSCNGRCRCYVEYRRWR